MELKHSKHRAVKFKVNGNRIYIWTLTMMISLTRFHIRSDMPLKKL
jgi:hypothetical protein